MLEWQNLDVWKEAHRLVLKIYPLAYMFPDEERFRMRDQICRCASSVPANIVEGHARYGNREYIQFLYIARGSTEETRYHLLLARDLGYIKNDQYEELDRAYTGVSKMLNALISSLRKKNASV